MYQQNKPNQVIESCYEEFERPVSLKDYVTILRLRPPRVNFSFKTTYSSSFRNSRCRKQLGPQSSLETFHLRFYHFYTFSKCPFGYLLLVLPLSLTPSRQSDGTFKMDPSSLPSLLIQPPQSVVSLRLPFWTRFLRIVFLECISSLPDVVLGSVRDGNRLSSSTFRIGTQISLSSTMVISQYEGLHPLDSPRKNTKGTRYKNGEMYVTYIKLQRNFRNVLDSYK